MISGELLHNFELIILTFSLFQSTKEKALLSFFAPLNHCHLPPRAPNADNVKSNGVSGDDASCHPRNIVTVSFFP
jgi:hypothetical protein